MRFWSVVIFVISFVALCIFMFISNQQDTLKVGLIYSKSGTMRHDEKIIAQMVNFAVEEANSKGGMLGKKIELFEYDGASDAKEFKKGVEYFASKGIKTVFGCWTSASRKSVKPVIEKNDMLLFYPLQYEGVESSKNIVYLGLTPNQQINPTLQYIQRAYGNNIYIVGSNYIYPRVADIYIKEISKLTPLNVLGYDFKMLGEYDFRDTVADIRSKKPDAVINLINGSSNVDFFKEFDKQGLSAKDIPIFSMSIDENSVKAISKELIKGHYTTWTYFSSIESKENQDIKERLKNRFGKEFILTDSGYSIYTAFRLWEKVVKESGTDDVNTVLKKIKKQSLKTAAGIVYVDQKNNHLHKEIRIAKYTNDTFKPVWESKILVAPTPYKMFQTRAFWEQKVAQLYSEWGEEWQSKDVYRSHR